MKNTESFRIDLPTRAEGYLDGAEKRQQSVTAEWESIRALIDGVELKEIRSVPKGNGFVTEIFRRDWLLDDGVVDQVFQVTSPPGAISAWHTHRVTRDRFFCLAGLVRLVLFDGREASKSHGTVNELHLSPLRPQLVGVPAGVWHGVQNIGGSDAVMLNLVDHAYAYDDPDHWGLPADSDQIPYTFVRTTA